MTLEPKRTEMQGLPGRQPRALILTEELIHAAASDNGGWTKKQLAILGVDWPPKKGWLKCVTGQEISESAYQEFLNPGTK